MKKSRVMFLLLCILFVSVLVFFRYEPAYQVIAIQPSQLEQLEDKQEQVLVYFKKASCPDCQKLDDYLKQDHIRLVTTKKTILYSLDLEQIKNQQIIDEVKQEYNLKQVPTVIDIRGNQDTHLKLPK